MKTRNLATTTFAAIAEEGFIDGLPIVLSVPEMEKEMVKTGFFGYLGFALRFAPAGLEEKEIRAKLASIGVVPGKTFDFKDLSMEHKAAVQPGMKEVTDKVEKAVAGIGKTINGLGVYTAFGDHAFFNGDWLLRAAAAKIGIYGNDADEAMYPKCRQDAAGSWTAPKMEMVK